MIKRENLFWKFADYHDELDDWVGHAEHLITEWREQKEVSFESTWQVQIAAMLLFDDLLPPSARKAIAKTILSTLKELDEKKLTVESMHITAPPSGRQPLDMQTKRAIIFGVRDLINEGLTNSAAYAKIAKAHHKSPDTIRRIWERSRKKATQGQSNKTGPDD